MTGSDAPSMAPITYTNANDLTWVVAGSRVEMLSNLPLDELLKVAAGLVLGHVDTRVGGDPLRGSGHRLGHP